MTCFVDTIGKDFAFHDWLNKVRSMRFVIQQIRIKEELKKLNIILLNLLTNQFLISDIPNIPKNRENRSSSVDGSGTGFVVAT